MGRAMGVLHGVLNPHFADWPHLYFYLAAIWLAPLRLLGLVSDPASGHLWVRILGALFGSITVVVVFEERDGVAKTARLTANSLDVEFFHILTFT